MFYKRYELLSIARIIIIFSRPEPNKIDLVV